MASSSTSDEPLPLSELKRWMSDDTYLWIKEGDEKEELLKKELEENAAMNASNLFGEADSDDDKDDDERRRVQEWSSSTTSPDGIGGFQQQQQQQTRKSSDDDVKLIFILSESYHGFGDTLWSSARHVANTISNPAKCRELLFLGDDDNNNNHPLRGKSFLEVGAGAGVPSWAAMKCGAHVVCTDLSDTNRIRCMAECAERNYQQIDNDDDTLFTNASRTRVCPHDWGSSVDNVVKALNNNNTDDNERRLFDIIIAADCCYLPWYHSELLDSIYSLLTDVGGVAIVAFALHDNTDDKDVWKIVDTAKEKGFFVEVLESQQLSPPTTAMESKQGLVHTVRLTKTTTI